MTRIATQWWQLPALCWCECTALLSTWNTLPLSAATNHQRQAASEQPTKRSGLFLACRPLAQTARRMRSSCEKPRCAIVPALSHNAGWTIHQDDPHFPVITRIAQGNWPWKWNMFCEVWSANRTSKTHRLLLKGVTQADHQHCTNVQVFVDNVAIGNRDMWNFPFVPWFC